MRFIRELISGIIYFVFGVIVLLIIVRLLLDLFDIGNVVPWFIDITDYFLQPFNGLSNPIHVFGYTITMRGIIAIYSYIFFANILEQIVTSVFYFDLRLIFIEVVAAFFKFWEGLVAYRFVIKIFSGSSGNAIRVFVYDYTNWLVNPWNSVFPKYHFLNGTIETSSFVILMVLLLIEAIIVAILMAILLVNRRQV